MRVFKPKSKYWVSTAVAIAVCTGGLVAINQRVVLTGLQGMDVLVQMSPDAKEAGLTEGQIQTDVELKLRLAGIRVTSTEKGFLYVDVIVVKLEDTPYYSTGVQVSLNEAVSLARDPNIVTVAKTWDTDFLGIGGSDVVEKKVREAIKDMVDEFINDYLAANPKKSILEDANTDRGDIIVPEGSLVPSE